MFRMMALQVEITRKHADGPIRKHLWKKTMRLNKRIQNFVFLKMSNESEHFDNESYYPGERSYDYSCQLTHTSQMQNSPTGTFL